MICKIHNAWSSDGNCNLCTIDLLRSENARLKEALTKAHAVIDELPSYSVGMSFLSEEKVEELMRQYEATSAALEEKKL